MSRKNRQTHSQPELGVKSSMKSRASKKTSSDHQRKKKKKKSKKRSNGSSSGYGSSSGGGGGDKERRDDRDGRDDRDEDGKYHEQRPSVVISEKQEDLASVYANHPSITYIQ